MIRLGFILAVLMIILGSSLGGLFGDLPFDSTRWKEDKHHWTNVRYRMHKDLLRKQIIESISESQLVGLLGNPDRLQSCCPKRDASACPLHGCAAVLYWDMGPDKAVENELAWLKNALLTLDFSGPSLQKEHQFLAAILSSHICSKVETFCVK